MGTCLFGTILKSMAYIFPHNYFVSHSTKTQTYLMSIELGIFSRKLNGFIFPSSLFFFFTKTTTFRQVKTEWRNKIIILDKRMTFHSDDFHFHQTGVKLRWKLFALTFMIFDIQQYRTVNWQSTINNFFFLVFLASIILFEFFFINYVINCVLNNIMC